MKYGSRIRRDLERNRSMSMVVSRQAGYEPAIDTLADRMIDAYVDWREECVGVRAAHELWAGVPAADRRLAFSAYQAALEREEEASRVYADLVIQLATAAQRPTEIGGPSETEGSGLCTRSDLRK